MDAARYEFTVMVSMQGGRRQAQRVMEAVTDVLEELSIDRPELFEKLLGATVDVSTVRKAPKGG